MKKESSSNENSSYTPWGMYLLLLLIVFISGCKAAGCGCPMY